MTLDSESRAEAAYRELRAGILQGAFVPGQRLQASALEDRLHVGLTPIREALMRLSSEGLVMMESHRGARVADVSRAEFADLMTARREIEGVCLARAIGAGDRAWEAEIVASMHVLSRTPLPANTQDVEAALDWEAQHRRFHTALVAACGSAWLLRFWNTLVDQTERYRKTRALRHHEVQAEVRDATSEHIAIMDAVLRRDVSGATMLTDRHLSATEAAVTELLQLR